MGYRISTEGSVKIESLRDRVLIEFEQDEKDFLKWNDLVSDDEHTELRRENDRLDEKIDELNDRIKELLETIDKLEDQIK